jgi:glycosyltransferase involved in cell wall biosynthesis
MPSISVVIPTAGRRASLEAAIDSIVAQDYLGDVECIVVCDGCDVAPYRPATRATGPVSVRWIVNSRTPGPAGARNTGILASSGDCVGFLDDDDEWLPWKLTAQVRLWQAYPDAVLVGGGMLIRQAGRERSVVVPSLVFTDRDSMRIPSGAVLGKRRVILEQVGLMDESLPASYGEDLDFLLRAAKAGRIVCVPEPVMLINGDSSSFFGRWTEQIGSLEILVRKHADGGFSEALASLLAHLAVLYSAVGNTRASRNCAIGSIRINPLRVAGYAAYLCGLGLVDGEDALRWKRYGGRPNTTELLRHVCSRASGRVGSSIRRKLR